MATIVSRQQTRIRKARALCLLVCYGRSFSSSHRAGFLESLHVHGLNIALITGSTRTDGPPRPILGPRVATFISRQLEERGNQVTVVDPKTFPLLEKPHIAYSKSQIPSELARVQAIFQQADAYVCVTPEYNHAPSPGLVNVLNHFGSSTFSFKPSAIVSYSAGQWGGTRAALGLRPILSELGCLPVSAMIHIPTAQTVLDEDGKIVSDDKHANRSNEEWKKYCGRCFAQLEWWGMAAKEHRSKVDPFDESPSFVTNPSQRNAP